MTTEQLLFGLVPLFSLLVTAAVLIRRGGSESGRLHSRVRAFGERCKATSNGLSNRMDRIEADQGKAEEYQREDTQRIFTKLDDLDERNQQRHTRIRGTLTIQQRQITALMAVNPDIPQELITKLLNGEDIG